MRRREFLGTVGGVVGGVLAGGKAHASTPARSTDQAYGVLVEVDKCIGCRKCEWACNQANQLPVQPLETFEDKSVFEHRRRPDAGHYTVVNRAEPPAGQPDALPAWVKVQCMHCEDPACASACLVTALQKQENGAVTYDPWRCMGCRYCMVACPFQIPAYEYSNPLTPQVRKCTFCFSRIAAEGGVPACVEICPPQCLTFARRDRLVDLAHRKIEESGGKYRPEVYGEFEVGGTSWLYISSRTPEELGLPVLGHKAPPALTEKIQHGVFKSFMPPILLFAFLSGIMKLFRPRPEAGREER